MFNTAQTDRRAPCYCHSMLTTEHKLLTGAWTVDVAVLETAIGRFTKDRPLTDDCKVMLFEVGYDADLHVNVTHKHATATVKGWNGPGAVPGGFVHNRTFGDTPQAGMVRHIREMVFAART